jgi:hypothetical protein
MQRRESQGAFEQSASFIKIVSGIPKLRQRVFSYMFDYKFMLVHRIGNHTGMRDGALDIDWPPLKLPESQFFKQAGTVKSHHSSTCLSMC